MPGVPLAILRPGFPGVAQHPLSPATPLNNTGCWQAPKLALSLRGRFMNPLPCSLGHFRAVVICTKAIKPSQPLPGAGSCILLMTSECGGSPEASCWERECAARGTAGTGAVCPKRGVLTCDAALASLARCQKVPCPPTLHSDHLLGPWGAAVAHLRPAGRTWKSFPVSLSPGTSAGVSAPGCLRRLLWLARL